MISKSGDVRYWTTGITVYWDTHNGGWHALCEYLDDGWVGDNNADLQKVSTQGKLETRYAVKDGDLVSGLTAAVDAVLADAQRLGIQFGTPAGDGPTLYYTGDGEWADYPAPDGWRELLAAESGRLGWGDQ